MTQTQQTKTTATEGLSRWQTMAGERNARVVLCNTPDTYCLADLARHADRATRALRSRLMVTMEPDEVLPLLAEYKDVVIRLHTVIEKMSQACGLEYRVPRSIKRMLGDKSDEKPTAEVEELEESKVKQKKK
ncbi:MAG: hypothetical protein Q7J15_09375 [Candidatus Desulfaltia sp.]|nr:hypothetical protein [Candidatus Desulfaltia sp.]